MNHINITKTGNVVGIISIAFFLLCLIWGVILTDPVLKELHTNIIRITYPGFTISIGGVIIGLIEAFIYGWLFGVLSSWLCKKICIFNKN